MFQAGLGAHDEILLETPIKTTDKVAFILKKRMEEAEKALLKIAPLEAEVFVVGGWAEK